MHKNSLVHINEILSSPDQRLTASPPESIKLTSAIKSEYLISSFSNYDTAEEEILLNSNNLYIIDVISNVIDKNGKIKTIVKSSILSKDKTCYKGIKKKSRRNNPN